MNAGWAFGLSFLLHSTRFKVGFPEGGVLNACWVAKGTKFTLDFENGARNSHFSCVNRGADTVLGSSFLLHSSRC